MSSDSPRDQRLPWSRPIAVARRAVIKVIKTASLASLSTLNVRTLAPAHFMSPPSSHLGWRSCEATRERCLGRPRRLWAPGGCRRRRRPSAEERRHLGVDLGGREPERRHEVRGCERGRIPTRLASLNSYRQNQLSVPAVLTARSTRAFARCARATARGPPHATAWDGTPGTARAQPLSAPQRARRSRGRGYGALRAYSVCTRPPRPASALKIREHHPRTARHPLSPSDNCARARAPQKAPIAASRPAT